MSRLRSANWILGAAVALMLVLVGWQLNVYRLDRTSANVREDAVKVSTAQVLDLTTLDSDTVGAKLDAMATRTTGDFRQQLVGITATFQDLVKKNSIVASGSIDGAGVVTIGDKSATVLVASTSTITDKNNAQPASRTYRMRVKLIRSDDAWKINGMEFVQ